MVKNIDDVLLSLPEEAEIIHEQNEHLSGYYIKLPKGDLEKGFVEGITLAKMTRYLALERYLPWWIRPFFGSDESKLPEEVYFLLWERQDGQFGLLLPLICGDVKAFITAGEKGLKIRLLRNEKMGCQESATVLYAAVGEDPYLLCREAVASLASRFRTFRTREDKKVPEFVDYFGWCTWDAFYREVSEEKVLNGLESFKAGGLVPPLVILDDGWLDVKNDQLNSFEADKTKFPEGLKGVIDKAKSKYGVKIFGVWHTLQGYWSGVNPDSEEMKKYRTVSTEKTIESRFFGPQNKTKRTMIHPDDVHRFYQDWHRKLRRDGVDMVKVDNQASMYLFTDESLSYTKAMEEYQYALQGSAFTHFGGNLLHCMCNMPEIAYNMNGSLLWRNSDDFFPNRPESHQFHVHTNAMNNMWTSHFAIPDWDMFHSAHPAGGFHAAARAISGGPVYVSDKPEKHDFDIIRKLYISNGEVLRCKQPALPARDCLFVDCLREKKLLKITNRNGHIGVMGIFHCNNDESKAEIRDSFSPSDFPFIEGGEFAVYAHQSQKLTVCKREEREEITLPFMGYEIITFSPIVDFIAPLGLLDKYNGSAAILGFELKEGRTAECRLKDGGRVGFYAAVEPKEVLVSGEAASWEYNAETRLLVVTAQTGSELRISLKF